MIEEARDLGDAVRRPHRPEPTDPADPCLSFQEGRRWPLAFIGDSLGEGARPAPRLKICKSGEGTPRTFQLAFREFWLAP